MDNADQNNNPGAEKRSCKGKKWHRFARVKWAGLQPEKRKD